MTVGAGVVLGVRPQRGLAIAHERALQLPALEQLARGLVLVRLALGQVDRDDVEGGARDQGGALAGVDHVVGRGDDVGEGADDGGVVVEGAQGLDVGHGGAEGSSGGVAGCAAM